MDRLAELQAKLAELQDTVTELKQHITRLANLEFDDIESGSTVSNELSSEIIQILREQEEDLELLQEEITDLRPIKTLKHDRDRLKDGAERLKAELESCRHSLRKAQISAKENLKKAQKQQRELLWASFAQPRSSQTSGTASPAAGKLEKPRRKNRSEMSKDELVVASSSDVTQALRRTYDMMASELSRGEFARKTLQESTAALSQLSESYSSLDTILASSRDLLATLMTSQKSDTWYLETSFYVLAVTNAWLVFRRFLYGPLWWLVWLPLRLLFRGAVTVTGTVGNYGGASDAAVLDSTAGAPAEAKMNNEGIPTIQVGQQAPEATEVVAEAADGSLVEEIGRIIDESSNEELDDLLHKIQEGDDLDHLPEFVDQEVEIPPPEPERVRVEL